MIVIYVTCSDIKQAKDIGKALLKKRLCACYNVVDKITSAYFWPSFLEIQDDMEAVLLIKTLKEKFFQINQDIIKMHSYDVPCVFSISVDQVNDKYLRWLTEQIK